MQGIDGLMEDEIEEKDGPNKSENESNTPWSLILPFLFLCLLKSLISDERRDVPEKCNLLARIAEFLTLMVVVYLTLRAMQALLPYLLVEISLSDKTYLDDDSDCDKPDKPLEIETGSQTEDRNYVGDLEVMRKRHEKEIRAVHREIRLIRRKFAEKVCKTKCLVEEKNQILSKLQLKIPQLQKEKNSLQGEKAAIEKQLEEEKQRHRDLRSKFLRLHGQIVHNETFKSRNFYRQSQHHGD